MRTITCLHNLLTTAGPYVVGYAVMLAVGSELPAHHPVAASWLSAGLWPAHPAVGQAVLAGVLTVGCVLPRLVYCGLAAAVRRAVRSFGKETSNGRA